MLARQVGQAVLIDLEFLKRRQQMFGDHILQPFPPVTFTADEGQKARYVVALG